MTRIIFFLFLGLGHVSFGQIINTATMDSADYKVKGKVTVEGYIDAYYSYNLNDPETGDQPYLVSMSRHNEINVNLAFVDLKYSSKNLRARVAPGFGTYVNMNYNNEQGSLKNLIEANAGFKLFKEKSIWLDVGILGSPYTNESAISKDHFAYTRSLAAENVPYYLSGAKLSLPVSKKLNAYLYVINGWQQIKDSNSSKSFGSQLEFRPNNNLLLNWNTFIGKENTGKDSITGTRYFTDAYLIFNKNQLSMTSCIYFGVQQNNQKHLPWWQANIITRYAFNPKTSGTLRVEYMEDKSSVLILPLNPEASFKTFGISYGMNLKIDENLLFRTEVRQFISPEKIYYNNDKATNTSLTLTASICAWF